LVGRPKPNPFTEACHTSYSGLMTREDFGQAVVKTLGHIAPADINIMFRLVDKEENGFVTDEQINDLIARGKDHARRRMLMVSVPSICAEFKAKKQMDKLVRYKVDPLNPILPTPALQKGTKMQTLALERMAEAKIQADRAKWAAAQAVARGKQGLKPIKLGAVQMASKGPWMGPKPRTPLCAAAAV